MTDESTGSAREEGGASPPTAGSADGSGGAETRRMRRAVAEIRREGWKVAVVHATVDAAFATLLANLVVTLLGPSFVPSRVALPTAVVDLARATVGLPLGDPTVSGGAAVGVAVGAVVLVAEVGRRVRRPLVEQFEAANPGLNEALRTARDAVESGRDTRMARRLYEDVLAELRSASSVGLLDRRRLALTLAAVVVVSLATIQLAVIDPTLGGLGGSAEPEGPGPRGPTDYGGLRDPSAILGEPEDVLAGEANLDAIIDTGDAGTGGDDGVDDPAAYEDSGFADPGAFDAERAGFAETERLEDAELIRAYNLAIREGEDG